MGFHFNHLVFIAFFLVSLASLANLSHGQGTNPFFYVTKCPNVESIVRTTVTKYVKANPQVAPGLLRMFFHDCFIHGCDGSVLINSTNAERFGVPNLSLRGFDAIDEAKQLIEAKCPGIVSCADILALAARDSVVLTGGRSWFVPLGRRDGLVSKASDTLNLPGPRDTVDVQIQKFNATGLNIKDLVTLVGAHSIGTGGCGVFSYRLYNYNNTGNPDPTINPEFLQTLQTLCPIGGNTTKRVELDFGSGNSFEKFENDFFRKLSNRRGVLESDQRLWEQKSTNDVVKNYLGLSNFLGWRFNVEFGNSMVKMGNIGVKTKPGTDNEIRKVCSAINKPNRSG